MIPDEPRSAMDPSGIRIGTPALTTRGMKEVEIRSVADLIHRRLKTTSAVEIRGIRNEVHALATRFGVPGISLHRVG